MGNSFGDRYAATMDAARERYQPLIDEIRAATGLESWVWQSGGMTMTLVTPVRGDGDYDGCAYLTLVESFEPNGTPQGSSGWFDYEAAQASGEECDVEGTPVLEAYQPVGG